MGQEIVFSYKTRGNSSPKDKPRVYFTCHPDDFERYFEKVCEDIFKTHDCIIYYTEDMNADLSHENNRVDLERMNLFVIPVTFRLLTQSNRAMDSDFRFAVEKHIPVLPMMMESGIDNYYREQDKFGELQYIDPFNQDITAISYEEKLKKYLESILISDELAQRIREAFDAYIFLSYRKKDRAYANELMKLIHKNPELRDIAIWFDEFLTPGESFKQNIDRILQDSEMFTLLITPNLLEEPDGKPNFVMAEEYPTARNSGKEILPAEMENTDKKTLFSLFKELPECVDARNDVEFRERLLESLKKVAVSENNNDPEHNYLIGLAYLEGIDVEVNHERGINLITKAADLNLIEAIECLQELYYEGKCVKRDYQKYFEWTKKLASASIRQYGIKTERALKALRSLAFAFNTIGELHKAHKLYKKVYSWQCEVLGNNHPEAVKTLNNIGASYFDIGEYNKALEVDEKVYQILESNGEKDTLEKNTVLSNMSMCYSKLGNHKQALRILEKIYYSYCSLLGDEHIDTLLTLANQAAILSNTNKKDKALEIYNKIYPVLVKEVGENHVLSINTLTNMALDLCEVGRNNEAMVLIQKSCDICHRSFGISHPLSINAFHNKAFILSKMGDKKNAIKIYEGLYDITLNVVGENCSTAYLILHNLANQYQDIGENEKALGLQKKLFELLRAHHGIENEKTLGVLFSMAYLLGTMGQIIEAANLFERVYILRKKILGESHPDTVEAKNFLALSNAVIAKTYDEIGEAEDAIKKCDYVVGLNSKSREVIDIITSIYEKHGCYHKIKAIKALLDE